MVLTRPLRTRSIRMFDFHAQKKYKSARVMTILQNRRCLTCIPFATLFPTYNVGTALWPITAPQATLITGWSYRLGFCIRQTTVGAIRSGMDPLCMRSPSLTQGWKVQRSSSQRFSANSSSRRAIASVQYPRICFSTPISTSQNARSKCAMHTSRQSRVLRKNASNRSVRVSITTSCAGMHPRPSFSRPK